MIIAARGQQSAAPKGDLFCPLGASMQQGVRQKLQLYSNLVRHDGRRRAAGPFVIALAMVNNGTGVTGMRPETCA